MKALSVKSVHALRIAMGQKTMEIRSKRTHHRGPLLICVSKRSDGPAPDKMQNLIALGFRSKTSAIRLEDRPEGNAICVVDVVDCREMLPGDEADACHPFLPDHFVWKLSNVRPVRPFPVRGQLSMFDVDDSLIEFSGNSRGFEDRLLYSPTGSPLPVHKSRSSSSLR